ncbi:small heat shock protein HspH [Sphingomonas sp. DBB INV C78]|uniref:Hsp20 family protein n=1 Tax=Sphingomonas sp. DBB INV C78 TaxID=3349434 RepID=UPI0036D37BD5
MRTQFDFSPYRRSTVGFDRLFDLLETGMRSESGDGYPPFDLEKTGDNGYRITLAVPGFGRDEIEVTAQQNQLVVSASKREAETDDQRYLYRGIATRPFERRFQLADFVQVRGAAFENGLLRIELEREIPETMKPRKIAIGQAEAPRQIEGRAESQQQAA